MARKDREKAEQEASPSPESRSKRITPIDIQQKEFRLAFRGYNEREVDEFLDQLTEEVARLHADNRRLQEQVEFHRTEPLGAAGAVGVGAVPGGGQGDERGEAEEVLQQARAEADRIVAEARASGEREVRQARAQVARIEADAEARATPAVGGRGGQQGTPRDQSASRFLAREREFLQSLAGLIQRHAEAVKEDARMARRAAAPPEGYAQAPPRQEPGTAAAPAPEAASMEEASSIGEASSTGPGTPAAAEPGAMTGSEPGAMTVTEPGATTVAEPGGMTGSEAAADAGPVSVSQLDPVAGAEPDPVAGAEPGLVAGAEPDSIAEGATGPSTDPGPDPVSGGHAAGTEAPFAESGYGSPAGGGLDDAGAAQAPRFAMAGGDEDQARPMGGIETGPGGNPGRGRPSPPDRRGEPEPSAAYAAMEPDRDAGEDRSLRELFWGED